MPHAGLELTDERRGLRLVYRVTPADTSGRTLEMDWYAQPDRATVARPHVHPPGGQETWELLAGEAGYRVGKDEHLVQAPHEWVIPPDTSHVHPWNVGSSEMHVRQTIVVEDPTNGVPEGVGRYFETVFALSARGGVDEKGDIRDPLQSADSIRELLMPGTWLAGPPRWAQTALFAPLAAIGRLAGRKAYIPAEPARAEGGSTSG
jgi:hypothetical protein